MEIRKIQVTGGSSFIVTLPKAWVVSLKLKKNDSVGLISQSNGTLLVTPNLLEEPAERKKEFAVVEGDKPDALLRSLVAAYISGYSVIKISSKKAIDLRLRTVVRKFTSMAIGQEIFEESETSLVIKDLLNPSEMTFEKTIRRMHLVTRQMFKDSVCALKNGDEALVGEILARGNDVDRLCWLIGRQHNLLLRNPALARKIGITVEEATSYFLISRILERIGDHTEKIASNSAAIIGKTANRKFMHTVERAGDAALMIFDEGIAAFFSSDISRANKNIERIEKFEALCSEIDRLALKESGTIALSVGQVAESIRRIGEYSTDISEKAIDHVINSDSADESKQDAH